MTICWVERRDTPEHVLHITDGPIAVEVLISEPALRHLWGELGQFLGTETRGEDEARVPAGLLVGKGTGTVTPAGMRPMGATGTGTVTEMIAAEGAPGGAAG